jgi:uncharacterized membrane protein
MPTPPLRSEGARLWVPVLAVYVVALSVERFGIASASHGSDVALYHRYAAEIARGHIPYRDFFFEYPPGALVPILLAEPFPHYATAFKIVMAVIGAGALVAANASLRSHAYRQRLIALLAIAAAPALVGSVFVNRFDLWPALLAIAALALFVRGQITASFATLAAGAVTKIFPVTALPALAVYVWRCHGAATFKRAAAAFVAVTLAILIPFAALGPGGVRFSFTIQLTRHLQTESLGGAILLAAGRLGLYRPTIATGNPGSLDLFGTLPTLVGALSLAAVVATVAWTAWTLTTRAIDQDRALTAAVAATTAYVAFGKVLSPQYLLWLVPLVPLVPHRRVRASVAMIALLVVALVLTQIEFDHYYNEIHTNGPVVWILLLRDLTLVAIAGILLNASRPLHTNTRAHALPSERRLSGRGLADVDIGS